MNTISYFYFMELDHLRTLIAAVETGSLTGAARRRSLTQPAISLQVKALEQELGGPLFHRRGRGVVLTQTGQVLYEHAREILTRVRTARAEVAEVLGLGRGVLRLGVTDAAATRILPRTFARFHRRHPEIEVQVSVHPTAGLIERLQRGEIDLGVGTLPAAGDTSPDLEIRFLERETLGLVAPAEAGRVPLDALLERYPFIAYPRGSTTRGLIDRALAAAGLIARPRMEIGRPDVMIRLVEAGLGAAVLPRDVSEPAAQRGTVYRPSPRRFRLERRLGLIRLTGRSLDPAARAFAAMIVEGTEE
jgi:DNA-binding transcriptional LysR family regulator